MLVRLYKSQVSDALQSVAKAIEKRSYYQAIKLTFGLNYLIVQATNLERFLTVKVPLEQIGMFSDEKIVHVDGAKFAKFIRELDEEILIEPKDNELVVKSGRTKAKFLVHEDLELPEFPEPVFDVEFDARILLDAIERVSFAIDKDNNNLACLLIDGKEYHTNFVASDGHRLVIYKHPTLFKKQFRLHRSGLAVLKDLLDEADVVMLGASENMTFIGTQMWELALRNAEGEYPDYEAVIPTDYNCKAVFDAEEMNKALKRLLTLGKDALAVEMHVGGEEITMKTQSPDYGEIEVKVPVEEVEGEMYIGFNGKYLKEFIDNADGKVEMKLIDEESPMLFENGENYIYVLMPMRL